MDRLIARALTLEERLDRARQCTRIPVGTRLESYKPCFDPGDSDLSNWKRFLKDIGIGEPGLVKLASDEDFQGPWPEWAMTLRRLLDALKTESSRPSRGLSAAENLAGPVVRFAWNELARTLPNGQLRVLSQSACAQLRGALLARLARSAKRVADWECGLQNESSFGRLRAIPKSVAASRRDQQASGLCSPETECARAAK